MTGRWLFITAALAAQFYSLAGMAQVYKSVDETGKVIYSDRPVPGAVSSEEMALEPGPGEEQVKDAQVRAEETSQRAREMADERARKQDVRRDAEGQREPVAVEPAEESGRATGSPYYRWPRPPSGGHRPPGRPEKPPMRPKPPKPVQLPAS